METTTSGLHGVTVCKFIWLQRSQETIAQSFTDQSVSVCITVQSGAKKSDHPNDIKRIFSLNSCSIYPGSLGFICPGFELPVSKLSAQYNGAEWNFICDAYRIEKENVQQYLYPNTALPVTLDNHTMSVDYPE